MGSFRAHDARGRTPSCSTLPFDAAAGRLGRPSASSTCRAASPGTSCASSRSAARCSRSRRPPTGSCCASTACCARSPSTRCRSSRPTARSSSASTDDGEELGGLLITRHLHVLAALPLAVHRPRPARAADPAARRAGRAVRPAAPGRLLLGRLLAVEHAVPPRRRRAGRLPRRRRDRRAAPAAVRRPARATTSTSPPRTSPASCSTCRPAGLLDEDVDVVELARPAQPRYEVAVAGADPRRHRAAAARTTGSTSGSAGSTTSASTSSEMTIKTEPDGLRLQLRHPGRRGRPPPAPAVRADRPAGAGEPGPRPARATSPRFKAKWEDGVGTPVPDDLAARRWLDEKFYGTLAPRPARAAGQAARRRAVPRDQRAPLAAVRGAGPRRRARGRGRRPTSTPCCSDLPDTRVDLSSGPPTEEFEPIFD